MRGPWYKTALNPFDQIPRRITLQSQTFSDLAALINVRYRNQSEEEASAVHVAQAQTGSHQDNQHQVEYEPHRPPAVSQDSERRQLAKKINDIIKANTGNMETSGAGKSTGLCPMEHGKTGSQINHTPSWRGSHSDSADRKYC